MAEDEAQPGLLTKAQLREGLQNVERTLDGEGYAFSKLDVSGKGLTDLGESLPQYQHVRYLSVADNQLTDISAASGMYSLLSIDARNNKLEAVGDLSKSAFLQAVDASGNAIAEPSPINIPSVTFLNLNGNKLAALGGFDALAKLKKLTVEGNQLASLAGLGALPALTELSANNNPIASVEGLDGVGALETLRLDGTEVAGFDGLAADALPRLKALSLANAKVESLDEVAKLDALAGLTELTLDGCEVAGGDEYRLEVLIRLPRLQVLDGKAVSKVERREANAEATRRAEEAAAAAAEAAAEAAAAAEEEED